MTEQATGPVAPVFRPRRARLVAGAFAVVLPIALLVLAVALVVMGLATVLTGSLFVLFGFAVSWFCHRQASVSATPTPRGLVVRNLIETRRLDWAEIVAVRFPQGDAWVRLDLDDGSTLAVMAVQAADGARAVEEAHRLVVLVRQHGEAAEPGGAAGSDT